MTLCLKYHYQSEGAQNALVVFNNKQNLSGFVATLTVKVNAGSQHELNKSLCRSVRFAKGNMFLKRFQLGLNRVMIKELAISATLVAILASLPYLFSPIQVAIGSYSDRHPIFGFRRTPYILVGLVLCVLGVIVSPQVAFLMHDNFPLASEISGENGRGKTIATMWFMMIASIILTAIGLSRMVDPYSPEALIRAFGVVAVSALTLGLLGLIRLEPRSTSLVPPFSLRKILLVRGTKKFENGGMKGEQTHPNPIPSKR